MSQYTNMGNVSEEFDRGMAGATSVLVQKANEIRSQSINWQSYYQSQMINKEDYEVMMAIEKPGSKRDEILHKESYMVTKSIVSMLSHISKDHSIQTILTVLDDILTEEKSRVEMFNDFSRKNKDSTWGTFLNLLTRPDPYIVNITAQIIAKIACWSKEQMTGSDMSYYLTWLKDQLKIPNNEYLQTISRCLQMMLRVDEYRINFYELDGIVAIVQVLTHGKNNFQIQYQLTFCLWVLSYNHNIAEKMSKYSVIPALGDILGDTGKEKVIRITLAVLRNLIEKPIEPSVARENSIQMVQCKVLKHLEILAQRKFEDEDITSDIEFLNEKLQTSIQDLSSFEEYASELKSGRLEWSPVHKSEKFWRENASRLNEKNYELLKILIELLSHSTDNLVLAVACHDIGEYVRHYIRGKRVLEQLGGKQLVMQHLTHTDQNVRYEALLAVQKMMVHNWEYLGKQLEKETAKTTES